MPKICQRYPFVRAELRDMLSIGPSPSTTQAGTTTAHITRRMNPGTRSSSMPKATAMP